MATMTDKQRKEENQKLIAKLQTLQAGTPEYQKVLQRINFNRQQMGIKEPYKPGTSGTASTQDKFKNAKTQADLYKNEQLAANQESVKNAKLGTAGSQTDIYGNTQTIEVDESGNVIQKQQLGADQQALLDAQTERYKTASEVASDLYNQYNFGQGFNPNLTARTGTGDLLQDRARIEQETYGYLTRDLEQNYNQEKQQMEQTLINRGVPPEEVANRPEMKSFERRYQDNRENARRQAVMQGGEEYQRSFGIGEQLRANELSEQSGIRGQQISEVGQFTNLAGGPSGGQFDTYRGSQYDTASPTDIFGTVKGINLSKQQLELEKKKLDEQKRQANQAFDLAKSKGSGGGGGGEEDSAFVG